jgi:hypothetical protein
MAVLGTENFIHPDLFPFFCRILDLMSKLDIKATSFFEKHEVNFKRNLESNETLMQSLFFEFHDFYIMCGNTSALVGKDVIAQEVPSKITTFIKKEVSKLTQADRATWVAQLRLIKKQEKFWNEFIIVLEGFKTYFSEQAEKVDDVNAKIYEMLAVHARCIYEIMLPLTTSDGKFKFIGNQESTDFDNTSVLTPAQSKVAEFMKQYCGQVKTVFDIGQTSRWLSPEISSKLTLLYRFYDSSSQDNLSVGVNRYVSDSVATFIDHDKKCQWDYNLSICSIPNSPVLIFLRDFLSSEVSSGEEASWYSIAESFSHTFTVLNVNGLRLSAPLPVGNVHLQQIISSLHNLLNQLKITKASIVGKGIGGLLALEAAKNMPTLHQVVTFNTHIIHSPAYKMHIEIKFPSTFDKSDQQLLSAFRQFQSDQRELWKQFMQRDQKIKLIFNKKNSKCLIPDEHDIAYMPIGTVSCDILDGEGDLLNPDFQHSIKIKLTELLESCLEPQQRLLQRAYSFTGIAPIGSPQSPRNMKYTGSSPKLERRHTL